MNKSVFLVLIISILSIFGGCSNETPLERQVRLDRQHELNVIRAANRNPGGSYSHYRESHNSFAENMVIAAAAGYAYSAFQPRYAPLYDNGNYYDRNRNVISKTVYETRIKTVEVDKKSYNTKKKADFKKWKSNPKNANKLAAKSKQKTGSKVAASKKWAGSKGTSKSHWAAAKTSKKPKKSSYKKSNSYKPRATRSYSSKSRKRR